MKKSNLISVFLLSVLIQSYSYAASSDPGSAWPRNMFPITYVMDNTKVPVDVVNSNSNRNQMISSINEWNQSALFGSMVYAIQGSVDNSTDAYDLRSNINEIKFLPWNDTDWPTKWGKKEVKSFD